MKKILEYNSFELLKNTEIYDFLKKVKTENPYLYNKFINIVKKKGLEIAEKEYQKHDPKYKKFIEKAEKQKIKKEEKEMILKRSLDENIDSFNIIKKVSDNSILKNIFNTINSDKTLNKLFKELKKKYTNHINKYIKNPVLLKRISFDIDELAILKKDIYSFENNLKIIQISQRYNKIYNSVSFNILFSFPFDVFDYDEFLIPDDFKKEIDFLSYRNDHINKLSKYSIDEDELKDIIFNKLKYFLTEDFYKDWKIENDANKYNL